MLIIKLFFLSLFLIAISCSSKELIRLPADVKDYQSIQVVTYNTGLAKVGPLDLVPCIKHREDPQVIEVFTDGKIIDFSSPFIIGLQEVFTRNAFDLYSTKAKSKKLNYYPKTYNDIKNNGQMFITNMYVTEYDFLEFSKDIKRRGIQALSITDSTNKKLLVINTHTSYSNSANFLHEHRLQIEEIINYIASQKHRFDGIIALGDFNAGPNLDFIKSKYDVASTIWNNNLLKLMREQGLKISSQQTKNTWDLNNKLVSREATPIVIGNLFLSPSNTPGWEEKGSILDHIFSSQIFNNFHSEVILDRAVTFKKNVCQGRYQSSNYSGKRKSKKFVSGELHLSDHFGVKSVLFYK